MERKDSIRRFLREHLRDDKKSKENKEKYKESKESKESKDNKENSTSANTQTAITYLPSTSSESLKGSSTEVKSKSTAYRLFRTVSFN